MPTYEAATSIHATPDAVWGALSCVTQWPAWLPKRGV